MTDTKLPTEAEIDGMAEVGVAWCNEERFEELLELGRAYYAQRRALQALAMRLSDEPGLGRGIAKQIEALLGEGGS